MTLKQHQRQISCARCGVLIGWSWTEGDKTDHTSNLNAIFAKLAPHQRVTRGHVLTFTEKVVPFEGVLDMPD